MNIIQGFVTIPTLADNAVGQIAKFGEFSEHAQTYTRDLRHFSNPDIYPHIEIMTVKAINEQSQNITIPTTVVGFMLQVGNWVYKQYSTGNIPLPSSKTVLQNAVSTEFSFATNVRINEILPTALPSKRLIDNIRFDCSDGKIIHRVTLWFSDERFRIQYNYYDIIVIPPVDDLDRLTQNLASTAVALQATTIDSVVARIGFHTRKNKPTNIVPFNLTYHDPTQNDKESLLQTTWTLMLYGSAAEDTESMKSAIRDYLADNSNYAKWHIIFPDLYSTNEFIIIPFWDARATEEDAYDNGLYRSLISTGKIKTATAGLVPNSYKVGSASDMYLSENTMIGSVFYRTMIFMSLGSPSNSNAKHRLTDLFPDYMALATDSPDFGRMSIDTQNFVLKLNDCFNKARLYSPNEKFPEGFTRATKGSRTYIGFDSVGYTFYVMTREGYLKDN